MQTFERLFDGRGRLIIQDGAKYILLPIFQSEAKEELTIERRDGEILRFAVPNPSDTDSVIYYAPFVVDGSQVTITGNFTEAFWKSIQTSDCRPKAADLHPAIHFAALNGWINDPNGLIYRNGIYHMFFQFNPVDTVWGNMSWGHAISSDLLHWQQCDDAIYPDEDGTIFSGSAIDNRGKCLSLPEDALIFFYTSAGATSPWSEGKSFTQKIAYSTDNARTLVKIREPAVANLAAENRDPKVYRYGENNLYYMVLYLENDKFAILNSTDLRNFTVTQHIFMEGSGECPDLRRIPCEDGTSLWMFIEADGHYYLGNFDGSRYETKSDLQCAYHTDLMYAAQTVSSSDDRVIFIPWVRTFNKSCTYTGMMGLPRELALVKRNGQYRLRLKPIKEYFDARRVTSNLNYAFDQNRALEIELCLDKTNTAKLNVGGIPISYEQESGLLTVGEQQIEFEKELDGLHILIDKGIFEISSSDYVHLAAVEATEDEQQGPIIIETTDIGITVYEITA